MASRNSSEFFYLFLSQPIHKMTIFDQSVTRCWTCCSLTKTNCTTTKQLSLISTCNFLLFHAVCGCLLQYTSLSPASSAMSSTYSRFVNCCRWNLFTWLLTIARIAKYPMTSSNRMNTAMMSVTARFSGVIIVASLNSTNSTKGVCSSRVSSQKPASSGTWSAFYKTVFVATTGVNFESCTCKGPCRTEKNQAYCKTVHTGFPLSWLQKNSRTFPTFPDPRSIFPGPCRKQAMFKYSNKQQLRSLGERCKLCQ